MWLKWIMNIVLCAILVISLMVFLLIYILRLLAKRKPDIVRHESEKVYVDRRNGCKRRFPVTNLFETSEESSIYLSVVIPAYNEETRLPLMMDETMDYLETRRNRKSTGASGLPSGDLFSYEVIIVDDGSKDRTTQMALDYSEKYGTEKVRVLTLERNRGKGGAVRLGVLSSRGRFVLFADADGATKFSEIEKLEAVYSNVPSSDHPKLMAIGSRAHLEEEAIASRSAFRTFLMHGFHFLVWFSAVRSVRDTQCGFKMMHRKLADVLFNWIHVEKWAFDVELLHISERINVKIIEVCVSWTEIEGSKIVPVFSWLQMGKDVLFISLMYTIGAWSTPPPIQ